MFKVKKSQLEDETTSEERVEMHKTKEEIKRREY